MARGVRSKPTFKFNAKTYFNRTLGASRFVSSNPTSRIAVRNSLSVGFLTITYRELGSVFEKKAKIV